MVEKKKVVRMAKKRQFRRSNKLSMDTLRVVLSNQEVMDTIAKVISDKLSVAIYPIVKEALSGKSKRRVIRRKPGAKMGRPPRTKSEKPEPAA